MAAEVDSCRRGPGGVGKTMVAASMAAMAAFSPGQSCSWRSPSTRPGAWPRRWASCRPVAPGRVGRHEMASRVPDRLIRRLCVGRGHPPGRAVGRNTRDETEPGTAWCRGTPPTRPRPGGILDNPCTRTSPDASSCRATIKWRSERLENRTPRATHDLIVVDMPSTRMPSIFSGPRADGASSSAPVDYVCRLRPYRTRLADAVFQALRLRC